MDIDRSETRFFRWLDDHFSKGTHDTSPRSIKFKLTEDKAFDLCRCLVENDGWELKNLIVSSHGLFAPKQLELDFRLGKERDNRLKFRREYPPERKLKEEWISDAIWWRYWGSVSGEAAFDRKPFLHHTPCIHSYEVPLRKGHSGKARGYRIDLLGATTQGLPAIVEVKTGYNRWDGLAALFCQIVQGLAYGLTIRHHWSLAESRFRDEWRTLGLDMVAEPPIGPLKPTDVTPIIALGDEDYWRKRDNCLLESKEKGSQFLEHIAILAAYLKEAGMPVHLVKVVGYKPDLGESDDLDFVEKPFKWLDHL